MLAHFHSGIPTETLLLPNNQAVASSHASRAGGTDFDGDKPVLIYDQEIVGFITGNPEENTASSTTYVDEEKHGTSWVANEMTEIEVHSIPVSPKLTGL